MLGFWSCNLSLVPNIKTCWHLISLFLLKIARATSRYYQKIGRRKNWSSCTFLHIYICRWWWFGGFLWCMSFVMWTEVLSCCGSVPECIASLVSCNILFFKLSWFLRWVGELERLENSFGWLMAKGGGWVDVRIIFFMDLLWTALTQQLYCWRGGV